MKRSAFVIVLVLAVAALFLWNLPGDSVENNLETPGPEYGIGGGPPDSTPEAENDTTIDESARLNTLLQEHAVAASFHLQNIYDGRETTETTARLQNNSNDLANFFQEETEADIKNEFLIMWEGHIQSYEDYTQGLKNNDRDATTRARSNLATHASHMGELINRAIPAASATTITQLMNEHIDLTLSIIEAHARGDTTEKLTQSTRASTQAVGFADEIMDALEGEDLPSPSPGI